MRYPSKKILILIYVLYIAGFLWHLRSTIRMLFKLLSRYMQSHILLHDNTILVLSILFLFFYDSYNINRNLFNLHTINLKLQLSMFKYSNNYNCTHTRIFGSRIWTSERYYVIIIYRTSFISYYRVYKSINYFDTLII